jgi:hypothetical protein
MKFESIIEDFCSTYKISTPFFSESGPGFSVEWKEGSFKGSHIYHMRSEHKSDLYVSLKSEYSEASIYLDNLSKDIKESDILQALHITMTTIKMADLHVLLMRQALKERAKDDSKE